MRAPIAILGLLLALPVLADEPAPDSPAGRFGAAVRKGDVGEVRRLLDAGVDVNTTFRYGATALFPACDRGHAEVVRLLLERGVRTDVRDTFYGLTAFGWALTPAIGEPTPGHVEIVGMLLAKGAGSRAQVLSTGVRSGRVALVKLALQEKLPALDLGEALAAASSAKEVNAEIVAALKAAGAQPLPEPKAVVDKALLDKYAGDYAGEGVRAMRLSLVVVDGGLAVRLGGDPIPAGAYDEHTFVTLKDPKFRFTIAPDGESLVAVTPGGESLLKRTKASQR